MENNKHILKKYEYMYINIQFICARIALLLEVSVIKIRKRQEIAFAL
jgi:hypothetical protein